MALPDINTMTAEEIAATFGDLEGVGRARADDLAERFESLGFIRSRNQLLALLVELGVDPARAEELREDLNVGPREDVPPYEPLRRGADLAFDRRFVADGDPELRRPEEVETPAETPFTPPERNRPLVVVPGIMGSELYIVRNKGTAAEFREPKWPPVGLLGVDIFKELEMPIREQLLVAGTEPTLDAYSTLLTNLDAIGYVRNRNLLFFAYNWIQSNLISGAQLKRAIDIFLAEFNSLYGTDFEEVDVICHSMGGLVMRSAIVNNQAAVNRVVYVATPHYGAPKAYFVLHPDIATTGILTELAFDIFNLVKDRDDFDDVDEALNRLASLCPSVYELLPNRYYIENVDMLEIDPGPFTLSTYYTKTVSETYFENKWQFPIGTHLNVRRGTRFTEELGREIPGEHLLILCNDLPTDDEVQFEFDVVGFDEFFAPVASVRGGDETVPTWSAVAGGTPPTTPPRYVIATNHTQLPNSAAAFRAIKSYLSL